MGAAHYPLHSDILNSHAVAEVFKRTGTYLLPQTYPEGCPQHTVCGSGHGTVAGPCVTILKTFFSTDNSPFPNPMVPSPDGSVPAALHGRDANRMTLIGPNWRLTSSQSDETTPLSTGVRTMRTPCCSEKRLPSASCATNTTAITSSSGGSPSPGSMGPAWPFDLTITKQAGRGGPPAGRTVCRSVGRDARVRLLLLDRRQHTLVVGELERYQTALLRLAFLHLAQQNDIFLGYDFHAL